MVDATLAYNFQQLHVAVLAQEALAVQLQATIAAQVTQVLDLRTRLDALAREAGYTLDVPPPPDSAAPLTPLPEPSVSPKPAPEPVAVHTPQPVPPSVPRTPSRGSRSSGGAEE